MIMLIGKIRKFHQKGRNMDLVLGADSMIGQQVCKLLPNCRQISHKHYDLRDFSSCQDAFDNLPLNEFNKIWHFAGYNGGIGFNLKNPADIYYNTSAINLNVLRCCQQLKVDKLVTVIASCSYPDLGEKILEEKDLWDGLPNESVECHGLAKRTLHAYSRQLYKQYGLKTVNTILTNCYGPGDRFDVSRTKVVGAVVKKLCDAKLNNDREVTFFGTGRPKRELMYCQDAARCLVELSKNYDDYMNPVNVGSDEELEIGELVYLVARLVEYTGEILWDTNKPDGQMRKKLDTSKMKKYIDIDMTSIKDGLKNTIKYYQDKGRFLDR